MASAFETPHSSDIDPELWAEFMGHEAEKERWGAQAETAKAKAEQLTDFARFAEERAQGSRIPNPSATSHPAGSQSPAYPPHEPLHVVSPPSPSEPHPQSSSDWGIPSTLAQEVSAPDIAPPQQPTQVPSEAPPQPDQHPQQTPESTDASPKPSSQPEAPAAEAPKGSGRYGYQGDGLGDHRVDFVSPDPSPQPDAHEAEKTTSRRPVPPPPPRRTPPPRSDSARQRSQGAPAPGNAARMRGSGQVPPGTQPRPTDQARRPGGASSSESDKTKLGQKRAVRQRNLFDVMGAHRKESGIAAAVCAGGLGVAACFGGHAMFSGSGGEGSSATEAKAEAAAIAELPSTVKDYEPLIKKAENDPSTDTTFTYKGKKYTVNFLKNSGYSGGPDQDALILADIFDTTAGDPNASGKNGDGAFPMTAAEHTKILNEESKANDNSLQTEMDLAVREVNDDLAAQVVKEATAEGKPANFSIASVLKDQESDITEPVGDDLLAPEGATYVKTVYAPLVQDIQHPGQPPKENKLTASQVSQLPASILNNAHRQQLKKTPWSSKDKNAASEATVTLDGKKYVSSGLTLTDKEINSLTPEEIMNSEMLPRKVEDFTYIYENAPAMNSWYKLYRTAVQALKLKS